VLFFYFVSWKQFSGLECVSNTRFFYVFNLCIILCTCSPILFTEESMLSSRSSSREIGRGVCDFTGGQVKTQSFQMDALTSAQLHLSLKIMISCWAITKTCTLHYSLSSIKKITMLSILFHHHHHRHHKKFTFIPIKLRRNISLFAF